MRSSVFLILQRSRKSKNLEINETCSDKYRDESTMTSRLRFEPVGVNVIRVRLIEDFKKLLNREINVQDFSFDCLNDTRLAGIQVEKKSKIVLR